MSGTPRAVNEFFFEDLNATAMVGFISQRLIKAENEDYAIATAKRDILVDWNRSFNLNRRLGLPILHLEHAEIFKGWLKPKAKHDYYWYTDNEQKKRHIDNLISPPRKWYWYK